MKSTVGHNLILQSGKSVLAKSGAVWLLLICIAFVASCGHGGAAFKSRATECFPRPSIVKTTLDRTHIDQPTARCRDGWLSYSMSRQGTCSHHGGVAKWLKKRR